MGFIGYAARRDLTSNRDVVRVFINCVPSDGASVSQRQPLNDPADLSPPDDIRFLHAVDVVFEERGCGFTGLDSLSSIRKFHRFMGALGERAREMGQSQDWPYESTENLLETLARIKNSRDFGSTPSVSSAPTTP